MKRQEDDRGFLYIDPQYIRDIEHFVKLGKFKISNDRYKYSTNNIVLPFSFNIDDLFLNNEASSIKIPKKKLDDINKAILVDRQFGELRKGTPSFYYRKYHEFMDLEDYLEFDHKYLAKRMEESERQRYKIKFANEVQRIKMLKTAKFIETEKLKLGGTLTKEQRDKLDQKIIQFQDGLNYAIEKLNYHQAQKMLRKLNTIPQPPLKLGLGKRTRLYSFKTGQNLTKALNEIIEEPGMIEKNPELLEFQNYLDNQREAYRNIPNMKLGEILKKEVQGRINNSIKQIDKILQNGPKKKGAFLINRQAILGTRSSTQNLDRVSNGGSDIRPGTSISRTTGKRSTATISTNATTRQ